MKMGRRARRAAALVLLLIALLAASTCDDPTGVQLDITGISGPPSTHEDSHFHRCTIPGRDITMATAGNHTYTSTAAGAGGHTHQVVLSSQQLLDLQQPNAEVAVDSRPDATGHTHSFLFQH